MANPYEGDSITTTQAGLTGRNTASGGNGNGIGVLGKSANGEGVHGETDSTQFAAVAGIELNAKSNIAAVYGEQRGNGPGVYGIAKGQGHGVFGGSATGEGVHGETNSTQYAAVAGINLNLSGAGAGVYGQSLAKGPAVIGHSDDGEGVHGETYSSQFAAVAGIQLNTSGTFAAVYGEQRVTVRECIAKGRNFVPKRNLTRYCNVIRNCSCNGTTACREPCWPISRRLVRAWYCCDLRWRLKGG